MGNSLGDVEWSGYVPVTTTADNGSVIETGQYGYNNGSWYTGFGAEGKWESLSQDSCPNFREDLEIYLSTAGSNSKSLLVSTSCNTGICAVHDVYTQPQPRHVHKCSDDLVLPTSVYIQSCFS